VQNLLKELESLLLKDVRFSIGGKLAKNLIVEYGLKLDSTLINTLLQNQKFKEHFFTKVGDVLFFDKDKFLKFVENKEFLPDSYTSFKNRIGLTLDQNYINESNEVVLSFPFKDCVLEGDQKDPTESRNEVFWNKILAPESIDRLLDPKVLTNFKRIQENSDGNLNEINDDDNLVIKGNNLLVLHSLKERYRGKIKLIYIDPPYNIGGDGFNYNDNFNHSTWLVFMKNRLEIAREWLKEDGVIFVQVDDNEVFHLKVLMDEIFKKSPNGKSNFVQMVEVKSNEGAANEYQNPFMPKICEYILIYAKNYDKRQYKPIWVKSKVDRAYNSIILNPEEKDFSKWNIGKVTEEFVKIHGEEKLNDEEVMYDFVFKNIQRIFQTIQPKGAGKGLLEAMEESKNSTWSVYKRESKEDILCYKGRMVRFYSKNLHQDIDGNLVISRELGSLWTDIVWTGIADEGGVKLKGGKKPEKLLRRIIEMSTEPGDLVLDFFSGSGTTAAVAHKMGRRYIAVEQLDYGENDTVERLKNVINGDKSGISKVVNWKGGGSFVYAELLELNQKFIEKLQKVSTVNEMLDLYDDISNNAFLNYQIDKADLLSSQVEFSKLSLEEEKPILLDVLDLNHIYVNLDEIDDKEYGVSENIKKFNQEFYKIGR